MTGAVIGAVGTVLAAIFTILVGYFVKRTDNAAKMTRANLADQAYTMHLVSAIRDDYWRLADAWYTMRDRARYYQEKLRELGSPVGEGLPEMPAPQHRELEVRHGRGEDTEE